MRLIQGDMFSVLPTLEENSIDSVVCDPPYELGIFAKKWDKRGISFRFEAWREVFRVMKPGAYLAVFGGTRTFHRVAVAIEDAGFEVRDTMMWLFSGQSMPKSLNISKALDKAAGAEREVIGTYRVSGNALTPTTLKGGTYGVNAPNSAAGELPITAPATDLAKQWDGWGTNLKPAYEPIIIARKPLDGTVIKNVTTWGVGGLNIDASRVAHASEADRAVSEGKNQHTRYSNPHSNEDCYSGSFPPRHDYSAAQGRWPANVVLSHDPRCRFVGSEEVKGRVINRFTDGAKPFGGGAGHEYESVALGNDVVQHWECVDDCPVRLIDAQGGASVAGGASRFYKQVPIEREADRFCYTPKASKKERNLGLDGPNPHTTVKPQHLMRYLVRMVTPPGGVVLDPFMGSGSTGVACVSEGFDFVGVELEADYFAISQARIAYALGE